MFKYLILGVIQGIGEWLPISSEGLISLVSLRFFGENISSSIGLAIFLHLGTFFAAFVYFWPEIKKIFARQNFAKQNLGGFTPNSRKVLFFLIVSTAVTGFLGVFLLKFFLNFFEKTKFSLDIFTLIIGLLLILTAFTLRQKPKDLKKEKELQLTDGLWAGLFQGLAVLPGLSRSGLTIALLLFRGFKSETALRLSFLMSLPAVLGGNIFLKLSSSFKEFSFKPGLLFGLLASFLIGYLFLDFLIKLSRRVNFSLFVFIFGLLVIASVFI